MEGLPARVPEAGAGQGGRSSRAHGERGGDRRPRDPAGEDRSRPIGPRAESRRPGSGRAGAARQDGDALQARAGSQVAQGRVRNGALRLRRAGVQEGRSGRDRTQPRRARRARKRHPGGRVRDRPGPGGTRGGRRAADRDERGRGRGGNRACDQHDRSGPSRAEDRAARSQRGCRASGQLRARLPRPRLRRSEPEGPEARPLEPDLRAELHQEDPHRHVHDVPSRNGEGGLGRGRAAFCDAPAARPVPDFEVSAPGQGRRLQHLSPRSG